MRPNAAWLGKDKQDDELGASFKMTEIRDKRRSTIASKMPDINRLISMKPKTNNDTIQPVLDLTQQRLSGSKGFVQQKAFVLKKTQVLTDLFKSKEKKGSKINEDVSTYVVTLTFDSSICYFIYVQK